MLLVHNLVEKQGHPGTRHILSIEGRSKISYTLNAIQSPLRLLGTNVCAWRCRTGNEAHTMEQKDGLIHQILKTRIQTQLLRWFAKRARDLPWRRTRDPYAIWVSEVMLQQTQVATVIPYFRRFLRLFPTVRRLAHANLSEVLMAWEGLGYYSRARNLHRAARVVLDQFRGKIPESLQDLLNLPGIGRSTAGAILSIAYNQDVPILDGNVKRVLSRLFAVAGDPSKGRIQEHLWHLSESLLPKKQANPFNQALMDLGATVCTPKESLCNLCPVRSFCKAQVLGNPGKYPGRAKRKKVPHVEGVSAAIVRDGKVLLHQRPPRGFSGGLWEFPNWKIARQENLKVDLKKWIKNETHLKVTVGDRIGTFEQTYSHFKLTLHVYHCQTLEGEASGRWVRIRDLSRFPMSRIHRRIASALSEDRKTRI